MKCKYTSSLDINAFENIRDDLKLVDLSALSSATTIGFSGNRCSMGGSSPRATWSANAGESTKPPAPTLTGFMASTVAMQSASD
jgi:hypothetical protein